MRRRGQAQAPESHTQIPHAPLQACPRNSPDSDLEETEFDSTAAAAQVSAEDTAALHNQVWPHSPAENPALITVP